MWTRGFLSLFSLLSEILLGWLRSAHNHVNPECKKALPVLNLSCSNPPKREGQAVTHFFLCSLPASPPFGTFPLFPSFAQLAPLVPKGSNCKRQTRSSLCNLRLHYCCNHWRAQCVAIVTHVECFTIVHKKTQVNICFKKGILVMWPKHNCAHYLNHLSLLIGNGFSSTARILPHVWSTTWHALTIKGEHSRSWCHQTGSNGVQAEMSH